jgi:hypothetical protein
MTPPADTPWDGSLQTIQPNAPALNLAQSANGTMVLAALNLDPGNSDGTATYSSGGAKPTALDVPGGLNQPVIVLNNWQGQNLKVANTSVKSTTAISVLAIGPGIGSIAVTPLGVNAPVAIQPFGAAQGQTNPNWMTLQLTWSGAENAVLAIIGGPNTAGVNGYVITLNATSTTGVPSGTAGTPVASGYYATTSKNTYSFPFNWQASWQIYVANMSAMAGDTPPAVTVTLLNS